jgi:hypothetical protein
MIIQVLLVTLQFFWLNQCEMSLIMLKPMAGKTKHANEPTNYSLQRALRPSIEEPN